MSFARRWIWRALGVGALGGLVFVGAAALAEDPRAPAACPACECLCRCPEPAAAPLPPEQDPERLLTRIISLTVGAGGGPQAIVDGPLVVTMLGTSCPVDLGLREAGSSQAAPISYTGGRFLVPEGVTLETLGAPGLCTGTIVVSGFRP